MIDYQERQRIEARAERFAGVFAPDAIDAALAACDEALFLEGGETHDGSELLKRRALYNVGAAFFQKAGYSFVVVNPD